MKLQRTIGISHFCLCLINLSIILEKPSKKNYMLHQMDVMQKKDDLCFFYYVSTGVFR